eukprot:m.429838 g.429838  ORF g.429838 m.429838 type:complete len:825 (+) comp21389_c0_seq2:105-2579(+)
MGRAKKSTKKFLKNELSTEQERRKRAAPAKKRQEQRTARAAAKKEQVAHRARERDASKLAEATPLEDMNVDEFFAKGFSDVFKGDEGSASSDEDIDVDSVVDDKDDSEDVDNTNPEADDDSDNDNSDEEDTGIDDESNQEVDSLKGEINSHKSSLERLKKAQPEFYKFLQSNDQELLAFAEDEQEDSDEDEEEESDRESGDDTPVEVDADGAHAAVENTTPSGRKGGDITMAKVKQWAATLKEFVTASGNDDAAPAAKPRMLKFKTFMHVVLAFQEAAHYGEEDVGSRSRFVIKTGAVFNALLSCAFKYVPSYLDTCLPITPPKSGKGHPLPSSSGNYKKLKGAIKMFLENVLHLLDKVTQPDTDVFVLQQTNRLCQYFASFPKLNRLLLKTMLKRWSSAEESVRVAAFLVMRRSAIVSPHPFIETALKGIYLTFIRNCKFASASTKPTLAFMLNSVVELYRLDAVASYQHAFVYIRQLAIHLRNASLAKKKDTHLQVYNWQYLYAIRVWSKLLAEEVSPGTKDGLAPLIYPLVQIVTGVIQLIPTPRYFPYRFQCIRALVQLVEKTGVYIPLASPIFDPLDSTEMKKRPLPSTSKPLVFDNIIKVPKSNLNTPQFQEAVLSQINACALRFFTAIAYSIGFPECTFPVTVRLRRVLKANKKSTVVLKTVKPLIDKLEESARFIQTERANVTFSPKDVAAMDAWSATLRASGKMSPIARHYKVWCATDANRRRKMEAVQDVRGNEFDTDDAARGQHAADDDDGDEEVPGGDLNDDVSAEEDAASSEEEDDAASRKKRRISHLDDDADDILGDFSMKEFDFDDDSE